MLGMCTVSTLSIAISGNKNKWLLCVRLLSHVRNIIRQPRKGRGEKANPILQSLFPEWSELYGRRVPATPRQSTEVTVTIVFRSCISLSDSKKLNKPFCTIHIFWRSSHFYFWTSSMDIRICLPQSKHRKKSAASSYLRMSNLSGRTWVYSSLAPFSCWCLLNRYNLMKNIKYLKSIYH